MTNRSVRDWVVIIYLLLLAFHWGKQLIDLRNGLDGVYEPYGRKKILTVHDPYSVCHTNYLIEKVHWEEMPDEKLKVINWEKDGVETYWFNRHKTKD